MGEGGYLKFNLFLLNKKDSNAHIKTLQNTQEDNRINIELELYRLIKQNKVTKVKEFLETQVNSIVNCKSFFV